MFSTNSKTLQISMGKPPIFDITPEAFLEGLDVGVRCDVEVRCDVGMRCDVEVRCGVEM